MKRKIVFTDLDGTLLDHFTYSFEPALPAIQMLREKDVPLVICSSKTRAEIEYYRKKLGNLHPFISENGGGIFIPIGYFGTAAKSPGCIAGGQYGYEVIRLGARYSDLRKAIEELRREGFRVRGFGDMTLEELSRLAHMTLDEAGLAKERDFDEPFILEGSGADARRLFDAIAAKGFTSTKGRFFHILGNTDKGKAVEVLTGFYRRKFGEVETIALGDSPNDIPMLERVDYPVIVRKPDGTYDPDVKVPNLIRADGAGPVGWNSSIKALIGNNE